MKPDKLLTQDIAIRLGDKKRLKTELQRMAKNNGITLNQLVIYIFEWFLEARKNEVFSIKLK